MLNSEQIKKILPHRYPFLMIDRAEIIEEGKKAVGYKMVSVNEPFFQGHFPQEAVMPGVLIVEAMAQLGAVAVLSMDEFKGNADGEKYQLAIYDRDKKLVTILKNRKSNTIREFFFTLDIKPKIVVTDLFMQFRNVI
ncbi:MAG TPA: 3-hydroxyacyl-ACP dehydratase FabZ, partial [bacterium]|nr:3-hydroxyacyl-ACP dehydratase FabZ [bacterium]